MVASLLHTIVHPMDHQSRTLTLSTDLTDVDPMTAQALCQQMLDNRNYTYAAPFVFDPDRTPVIKTASEAIMEHLSDESIFIEASRTIAEHLYRVIEGNHNIAVGELLIGLFQEDGDEPWLAIMKMQPAGDTYVLEPVMPQTSGEVRFALRSRHGSILGGVLQKCAFVAPPSLRTDLRDLIVLDPQALRRGNEQPAARFFIDGFLGCKIVIGNREMTRNLVGVIKKAARDNTRAWGPDTSEKVLERMDALQQGERIDVPQILDELIPEPSRAAILDELRARRVTSPIVTVELQVNRVELLMLTRFGGHLIIGQEKLNRRCPDATNQTRLSPGVQSRSGATGPKW